MLLSFTLSMPNVGSWDGKWTAEGNLYVKVVSFVGKKKVAQAEEILEKGYYHYNFGDGWAAGVTVKKVTAQEASKLLRKSQGFCGYEWMITSIQEHGDIRVKVRSAL